MKRVSAVRLGHADPKFDLSDIKPLLKSIEKQPVRIRRSAIRSLSLMDIPKRLYGLAFDKAFLLFSDHSETIAVRVFAMTVLTKIALKEPDLRNEVIIAIEEQLPFGSPAYINRAKKHLKELKG